MKKVLLMDMYSTIHVGNGALLENTINLCEQAWGECDFSIVTMDKETNKLKYKSESLYNPMFGNFWFGKGRFNKVWWAFKQCIFMIMHIINETTVKSRSDRLTFTSDQRDLIRAIEESDVCVSSNGEMLADTFYQMLPFWLFTYWLASKRGKPLVIFPQSIGPLKMRWTRLLLKWALKDAFVLAGRDKPSYETLISLGFERERIMFVPDVAVQQKVADGDVHDYFLDKSRKVVGITISNPPHREMGISVDFVEEIGRQIERLDPSVYKILIMPSNYEINKVSLDYALCLRLQKRLATKIEVSVLENRAYFPGEFSALLSQLDFFVSTRMHVLILATTVGTPTIGINTQRKIRGYMENVGMEHFCVDYSEINNIYSLMLEVISKRENIAKSLKEANKELRNKQEPFIRKLRKISSRHLEGNV
ncbi:polysaccharide pyruvyl transferase family protein [Marinobacter sp.]|uniref:polysaccharide pyruvyl transferase family protein n=1 Tax=Marinobacter sp. TaxID=50741 RepID=UPI001B5D6643|nr:polysaccharide pyruvyl transferase family protein [Marinobacter sp.]MBQ0831300.1 polysaccharide pyruvyl transferase family protein [Marinobacter sp.]